MVATEDSEEAVLEKALKAATAEIFHKEGTQYFTQSRWGAEPTPYEVTGLEVGLSRRGARDAGDKASGIDRRVTYESAPRSTAVSTRRPAGGGG